MKTIFTLTPIFFSLVACNSTEKKSPIFSQNFAGGVIYIQVSPEKEGMYKRKEWLPKWGDLNGDGINTRHQILIDRSTEEVKLNSQGNKVIRGTWHCPYTGITFHNPKKVDIDHFIPLKEASESGGWEWSADKQNQFANGTDSLELIVVESQANRDKSDKDPADWLPPQESYHCAYLVQWTILKATHELSMDQREFDVIQQKLAQCHKQKLSPFILKPKA